MNKQFFPYASIMLDIDMKQIINMTSKMLQNLNREELQNRISKVFLRDPKTEQLLPTLCVRGSFDMILQSYNWPAGSEILMTAVNIPSMPQIVRYHSCVPIPVNISFDTLAPHSLEALDCQVTEKTKAIVLSYIYGCQFNSDHIVQWAHSRGLVVIEDLAESFRGNTYTGHPQADFSLFSFGTIKTCTAFGGAITVTRNNQQKYQQLVQLQQSYNVLSNQFYLKRTFKNLAGVFALNTHVGNKLVRKVAGSLGIDYKEKMIGLVRGFPGNNDFLGQFRQQMPTAMLYLLATRLEAYKDSDTQLQNINQLNAQDYLQRNGVHVPGNKVDNRVFWLYPILVPEGQVDFCYEQLNIRGVDAYKGATQLQVTPPPGGYKYTCQPHSTLPTTQYFKNFLYLPIHKNVPADQIRLICQQVIEVVRFAEQTNKAKNTIYHNPTKNQSEELQQALPRL